MLEIEQAFNTSGSSVYEFFQRPGIGLYIPLYQREYSWDKHNIEQLLDDITRGVEKLSEDDGDDEIRFLGTIISVTEKDKTKIEPVDLRGLPTAIEKVIDGQQRISTICIFATQLYKHIDDLKKKFTSKSEFRPEVDEICNIWMAKLLDIFSLDLKRGTPERKPKIIRGHDDKWIKDGNINDAYKSHLANYLSNFIGHYFDDNRELPKPNSKNVGKNTKQIDKWLKNIVTASIEENNGDYISAVELLKGINEQYIWQYDRVELVNIVNNKNDSVKDSDVKILSGLVQIFSVCHYLLERCCFTHIQPTNDDWAFDMFQSLNASGTPLTAIETFKPLVVNTTSIANSGKPFKGTLADLSFEKIDDLFKDSNSASQKSKLTNDFLSSLAIVIDGSKLPSHFSHQRKWLDKTYEEVGEKGYVEQEKYIKFIGNYSDFYKNIWIDYLGEGNLSIDAIKSNSDAELASLLILFLKKSNHKMSITILGFFYRDILNGKPDSIQNFIDACKSITAFYTIWRSAKNNAGLDNVYRQFFKGEQNKNVKNEPQNWLKNKSIDIKVLKAYLNDVLKENDLNDKPKWMSKSTKYLEYKSKSLIQFILLTTSNDTIADSKNNGLMKEGAVGVSNYLSLEKYNCKDVATIEHIAPQKNSDESWDINLYDDKELVQKIGNLTLLPIGVNSSAGNKGWKEKLLYYKHLSEQDPEKIEELSNKANSEGILLNSDTILLLQNANYNDHIKSIVTLKENENWDSSLVTKRTERILSIYWEKIIDWLN